MLAVTMHTKQQIAWKIHIRSHMIIRLSTNLLRYYKGPSCTKEFDHKVIKEYITIIIIIKYMQYLGLTLIFLAFEQNYKAPEHLNALHRDMADWLITTAAFGLSSI